MTSSNRHHRTPLRLERSTHELIFWAALAFLLLVQLVGCVTTNAIAAADTKLQGIYATYGTYVVFQEQAVKLVQDPAVPEQAKTIIRRADAAAKPVADRSLEFALALEKIRQEVSSGASPEEKLRIAAEELDRYYLELRPLVAGLIEAVRGARQ